MAACKPNYSVNRTQIPLRGLCAGYLKRWAAAVFIFQVGSWQPSCLRFLACRFGFVGCQAWPA